MTTNFKITVRKIVCYLLNQSPSKNPGLEANNLLFSDQKGEQNKSNTRGS